MVSLDTELQNCSLRTGLKFDRFPLDRIRVPLARLRQSRDGESNSALPPSFEWPLRATADGPSFSSRGRARYACSKIECGRGRRSTSQVPRRPVALFPDRETPYRNRVFPYTLALYGTLCRKAYAEIELSFRLLPLYATVFREISWLAWFGSSRDSEPQYRGTLGSISAAQRSIPPAIDRAPSTPCERNHAAASKLLIPW